MKRKQFSIILGSLFETVLEPAGFSREGSKHCTFWRSGGQDVYHFIIPDPLNRIASYDVKVFSTSPLIDPSFDRRFPDALEIPQDRWCYLSAQGVGPDQELFNCKNEENLRNRFEKTVKGYLLNLAIPYLDAIGSIAEMIPWIKDDGFRAIALYRVGRIAEAHPLLKRERERLAGLNSDSDEIALWLQWIDEALK
jgi:hypothetical protein